LDPGTKAEVDLSHPGLLAKAADDRRLRFKKSGWASRSSYPDNKLTLVENFLQDDVRPARRALMSPTRSFVRALDLLFILHADHERTRSTSTVRLVGSIAGQPCSLRFPVAFFAVLDLADELAHLSPLSRISSSIFPAPPWLGAAAAACPTARLMPPEIDVNRLACDEPTSRTVDVRTVLLVVGVQDEQQVQPPNESGSAIGLAGGRTSSAGSSPPRSACCPVEERLATDFLERVGGDRRAAWQQPDVDRSNLCFVHRVQ